MSNVVIVGMQWGDEGKGKIVDLMCPAFDGVVRYQGGHNAGHTVKFGDQHFSLHLVPSGVLHPGTECVLGNGMVIAPDAFFSEVGKLVASGIDVEGRLHVSNRAHVILPWHAELDQAREKARGRDAIGTTSRGIGPAYEMKASRTGLRTADLGQEEAERRLASMARKVAAEFEALGAPPPTPLAEVLEQCRGWAEALAPYLTDTGALLLDWVDEDRSLLFEGAQGALLDIDHGTYPYVTSSSSLSGGACTGTGVPPTALSGVVGVLKAYTTRVGSGPFTTELQDDVGEFLRSRGNEFGTTTGRPRRCGWLDLVAARHARRLNGIDAICLTKLDVLDDLEEILICTGYRVGNEVISTLPADPAAFAAAEPVYEAMPGWQADTRGALGVEGLPKAAREYIERVEKEVGAPVEVISSGPRREETIVRRDGGLATLFGAALDRVQPLA